MSNDDGAELRVERGRAAAAAVGAIAGFLPAEMLSLAVGRDAAAAVGAIAGFLGSSAGVVKMPIRVNPTESNQIEADEGWPQKGARGAKKEWEHG